jgi:hypothetical protein
MPVPLLLFLHVYTAGLTAATGRVRARVSRANVQNLPGVYPDGFTRELISV